MERYTKKENVFAEFNTLKYRFMAVFGRQTEELFIGTNKILKSCSSAPTKSLIPSSPLPECSLVSIGEATDGTTCDVKNFGNASLVNRRLTKRYFGTRVPCQTKS